MNTVPWLRSGVGETPADGGCILQVIDWIDRNGWTDRPECVHPVFRSLAIYVNDTSDDEGRQKLLDLVPRLMNTNTGGKDLSVRLAAFCAREVLAIWEAKHPDDKRPRRAIEAAEKWINDPTEENANAAYTATAAATAAANAAAYAAANAAYAAAYTATATATAAATAAAAVAVANAANAAANAAATAYGLLLKTLDEYDRLTGRDGEIDSVDLAPVAEMMACPT